MPDKTLAMRQLDARGVPYEVIEFPETIHDALGVAAHAGIPPAHVFKTLVVLPPEPRARPLLILIPAGTNLDLRRAAEALGFKRLQMASQSEAERLTGLKVGGISALALLSKHFPVYLDRSAGTLETIVVSGGRRGVNLRMSVEAFHQVTGAGWLDAARPESPA
jgi:Cys-tRNA(Pro)/Cys-tRNA(Cys) deacylase